MIFTRTGVSSFFWQLVFLLRLSRRAIELRSGISENRHRIVSGSEAGSEGFQRRGGETAVEDFGDEEEEVGEEACACRAKRTKCMHDDETSRHGQLFSSPLRFSSLTPFLSHLNISRIKIKFEYN